ncbi:MAG TPA: type II secretion system F family protein [Candidatus Nanoarchaeia archaeon]|nr:type II secretion system F family protein [Candidatus Nanoarchaeia archaeon]
MEDIFPDVISLMASNLRSGITIDRAFLLAARPEFDPLDQEILKTGKEISTGQDIVLSLKKMAERISSEKISKVINLIISGLKAGGNISELLDQTSRNMKEKDIIEKKTRSTILMYVIFIFFAVGVGAPILFGLSTVLVEIVLNMTSKLPDLSGYQSNLPFSFTKIGISVNFVIYFSLLFITVTDFISCFVIGLVNKGEGKAGLKLFLPLLVMSLSLFVIIRSVLSSLMADTVSFG